MGEADVLVERARTAFIEDRWTDARRIIADVNSRLPSLDPEHIPSITSLCKMGIIDELSCDFLVKEEDSDG